MKRILPLSLLFIALIAKAQQFAVVSDKDRFVNVRDEAKTGNNITDTLQNGHLIYCFENIGNWTNIDYNKKNENRMGYIYKDRYLLISTFEKIPLTSQNKAIVELSNHKIAISVSKSKFDKSKHKLAYDADGYIEFIDGKRHWGNDGKMPEFEYLSILVNIGGRQIILPQKAIEGLFNPTLHNTEAFYNEAAETVYIMSMNSDGAGGYCVAWEISNGAYKERCIVHGF